MIRRSLPLLLLVLCIAACGDSSKDEPAVGAKAWGTKEAPPNPDSEPPVPDPRAPAPESPVGPEGSLPESARRASGPTTPEPIPREAILSSLRPETPPAVADQALLRAGLDALGEMPPSGQRDALTARLIIAWARRDAGAATDLALALAPDQREDALGDLLPILTATIEPIQLPPLLRLAALPRAATHRLLGRCARDLVRDHPDSARICHAARPGWSLTSGR